MSYQEIEKETIEHIEQGNPHEAFRCFRGVIEYPEVLTTDVWQTRFLLFARIAKELAGAEFAEKITNLAMQPDNVNVLYDVAYTMFDQQLYAIAANLLLRANDLAPGQPGILSELSTNFEELMLNHTALDLLQNSSATEHDALCCYLLGFHALMSGDVRQAQTVIPKLKQFEIDDNVAAYIQTLEAMVERAEALAGVCKLDNQDLTGWHMVINGGVLLHESPYGYNEGMSGRYCYIQDSYSLIKEGILRLRLVFDAAGIKIDRVVSAADRSSKIIAVAAASILDVPFEVWQPGDNRHGLLVAYDLTLVDDEMWEHASTHQPGQVLWAHANCWTQPIPFTPDIMTMQHQTNINPWEGGAPAFDPDTKENSVSEADNASEQDIAQRIVEASISDASVSSDETLLAMLKAIKKVQGDAAAGIFKNQGRRSRQRKGSPVKSSYFK